MTIGIHPGLLLLLLLLVQLFRTRGGRLFLSIVALWSSVGPEIVQRLRKCVHVVRCAIWLHRVRLIALTALKGRTV